MSETNGGEDFFIWKRGKRKDLKTAFRKTERNVPSRLTMNISKHFKDLEKASSFIIHFVIVTF